MAPTGMLDHQVNGQMRLDENLQLRILDTLIDALECESASARGPPAGLRGKLPLGRYAAVSKSWQEHVEKNHTFCRLTLTTGCLHRFETVFSPTNQTRRSYLRHIELLTAAHPESKAWNPNREPPDPSTIWTLLSILSKWKASDHFDNTRNEDETDGAQEYYGLTLEINNQPDTWANGVRVDSHTGPRGLPIPVSSRAVRLHSRLQRWRPQDFKPVPDPVETFKRYSVPVVHTLLLRRQNRHSLGPQLVWGILRHLPRCRNLVYEPWLHMLLHRKFRTDLKLGRDFDTDYARLISSIPQSIKSVTLFEDFDPFLDPYEHSSTVTRVGSDIWYQYTNGPPRIPSQAVAAALVQGSIHLTNLSASFLVEADDFFATVVASHGPVGSIFSSQWMWRGLEILTLTSRLLANDKQKARVKEMIISAAVTAQRMPRLQRMELWYAAAGSPAAAAFTYCKNVTIPEIAWRGTWEMDLGQEEILKAWKGVSGLYSPFVKIDVLDNRNQVLFTSHAGAVQVLGLKGSVAHPASIEEILREHGEKN